MLAWNQTDHQYEGATCAVTSKSRFAHQNNSQLVQALACQRFYRQLKADYNTYLTVPDPYWMSGGTNKEPMGYTDAWNRVASVDEYLTLGRMYLYDGTFHKPTTMGWLGFELSRTQPIDEPKFLPTLELAAASYLGQGNIPCYRGGALFGHNTELKRMWTLWVAHYKSHRPILMADMVHVRRPSGTGFEFVLHVNASASASSEIAFGSLFNPTAAASPATPTALVVPLYYANVRPNDRVRLSWGGSLIKPGQWPVPTNSVLSVGADYSVRLPSFSMAPRSFLWFYAVRVPASGATGNRAE
jgi:hypothetical protein